MKTRLLITALLLPCLLLVTGADRKKEEKWISLFNGKNLTDWTVKIKGFEAGENFGDTFRVEDGVMKVGYNKYENFEGKFGHIFYKKSYSHYRLRLEYRFLGEQVPGGPGWAFRNSGIMLHCQDPKSMGKDQNFPVSIEVQLLGAPEAGDRTTANLCTPGTNVVMNGELVRRHCTGSTSKTYRGDEWVSVEVEVRGGEVIKHIMDGQTVLTYDKPQLDDRDADAKKLIKDGKLLLEEGFISLQSESHPCEFRKVELLVLDK
jgi:hypothetical protein